MLKDTAGTQTAVRAEEEVVPEQSPATTGDPGATPTGPATAPTPGQDDGASEETTEDPASAVAPTNVAGAKTVPETKVGAPLILSNERRQLIGALKGWTELSKKVREAVRALVNAEAETMDWDERRHLYNLSRTTAACQDIGDEGRMIAEGRLKPAPTSEQE